VGAWNAGIEGYFSGGDVINLDGLMNDSILPYVKRGDLRKYLAKRNIEYLVDFNNVWIPVMSQRGGYGDGSLERCTDGGRSLFPEDPDNLFYGASMEIYRVNLRCADGSR